MRKVVVSYLACERCGNQGYYVEDNRGQGVISRRKLEGIKWCRCRGKAAYPTEGKVQQSSV